MCAFSHADGACAIDPAERGVPSNASPPALSPAPRVPGLLVGGLGESCDRCWLSGWQAGSVRRRAKRPAKSPRRGHCLRWCRRLDARNECRGGGDGPAMLACRRRCCRRGMVTLCPGRCEREDLAATVAVLNRVFRSRRRRLHCMS